MYALKRSRCVVYELKTDSLLYRPAKRQKIHLGEITYERLHTLRDEFEGRTGARRLDEACALPESLGGAEPVFRVQAATDDDRLKCDPKKPARSAAELCVPAMSWRGLSMEEAEHRVLRGESLLVQGAPGTGKTHYTQGLVELLRAQGKTVDVISKTHSASARAGGVTADHWVRKHVINGACTGGVGL